MNVSSVSFGQNPITGAARNTLKAGQQARRDLSKDLKSFLTDNMPAFKKYLRLNDEQAAIRRMEMGVNDSPAIVEYLEAFRKAYLEEANAIKYSLSGANAASRTANTAGRNAGIRIDYNV